MKVGKPQSKRVPVRLRHKIQKASTAKQRKLRKEAKKNPQWRSRLKKDPGIPNLFPHKAKMLAELEESKRRKEEEAQRRRDIAKAQRQGVAVPEAVRNRMSKDAEENEDDDEVLLDQGEESVDEDVMDEQEDSNPMAALLASAQARAQTYGEDDDSAEDDDEEDEGEDEWDGIVESKKTNAPTGQATRKALPKQALADPVKAVTTLLDQMQRTTNGIQRLIDQYQIPPLMTAGTDATSSFLVEVARKRGRLGKGGVPSLHSAALTVLGDLNDEKLQLPAVQTISKTKATGPKGQQEVKIVSHMAQPFRIEGLWGDNADEGVVAEKMVVEQ